MRRHLWALGLPIALLFMVSQSPGYSKELRSAAKIRFDDAVRSPPELRAFLQAMPKGADLHYHFTGGAYAENLIASGADRGACIDLNKLAAMPPPCDADRGLRPISDALQLRRRSRARGDWPGHAPVAARTAVGDERRAAAARSLDLGRWRSW